MPDAPGVTYQTITIGGQETRLFRCATHRADLTPDGCAARHREARKRGEHDTASGYTQCRQCAIGAEHAGLPRPMPKSGRECVRCGRWSARLVGKVLCVPCYNRQQEVLKARDRRGNVPKVHVRLWTPDKPRVPGRIDAVFNIVVMVNNRPEKFIAATLIEALEQATRAHHGETLTLAIPDAARLFAQYPRT